MSQKSKFLLYIFTQSSKIVLHFQNVSMRLIMTNTNTQSRRGVTILELMVVFAIMGFLATVGVPKFFGVAEKTREKMDLMKLYYLRDALNRALIEDLDALEKYTPVPIKSGKPEDYTHFDQIGSKQGAALFVIELHKDLQINVQGYHGKANSSTNICAYIGSGGTFYNALKEARFEGVADIVRDRLANNKSNKNNVDTYTAIGYHPNNDETKPLDYRTAPVQPIFSSRALNHGKISDNTRYTMSVRWSPGQEGYSVEVFLLPSQSSNQKDWQAAYKTDNGVCFSTYGRKGCKNSN